MARPNRHTNSVSLFPFLAVLVCAMGALIFLLLVTTRRIRSEALERARVVAQKPVESPRESIRQPPRVEVEVLGRGTETPDHVAAQPVQPSGAFPVDPESVEPIPVPPIPVPETIDQSLKWKERRRQFERELAAATQREFQLKQQMLQRVAIEQQQQQEAEKLTREISLTAKAISQRESNQALVRQAGGKLLEQIEQTREAIAAVRQAAAVGQSEFAFVPYDGASGTVRRPILIECTEDGFRFLPEDVFIAESEFTGFVADYNPLLAGADALLEFWNSAGADSAGKPYVLLIVRPEGTMAYYAARKLLGRLGSDFGYELIEAEASLALPEPDPEAQRKCREAVNTVLAQRDQVIASVRQQDQLSPEFGPSSRSGGRRIRLSPTGQIEIEEAPDQGSGPGGSRQRITAGGQAGAMGRGTSGTGTPPGHFPGSPSIAAGPGRAGSSLAAGAESIYGQRPVGPLEEPGVAAQAGDRGLVGSGRPGDSLTGFGGGTNGVTDGSDAAELGSTSANAAEPADRMPRNGLPPRSNGARSGDAENNLPQAQDRLQGNGTANRLGVPEAVAGRRPEASGDLNGAGVTGRSAEDAMSARGFETGRGADPNPRNAGLPGRENAQNGLTTDGTGAGTSPQSTAANRGGLGGPDAIESLDGRREGAPRGIETADGNFPTSGGTGTPGTGPAGMTSGGSSSGTSSGSPALPGSPGGAAGGPPGSASPSISLGAGSRAPARGLDANSRLPARKLWGLSPVGGTIGFEREVRVLVDREKVQVGRYFVRVPAAARPADLNAAVVDLIDLQARTWGNPPERFYWVPVLRFEVGPGGEPHYRQLAGAMNELGLTSERVNEQSAQPGRSVKN